MSPPVARRPLPPAQTPGMQKACSDCSGFSDAVCFVRARCWGAFGKMLGVYLGAAALGLVLWKLGAARALAGLLRSLCCGGGGGGGGGGWGGRAARPPPARGGCLGGGQGREAPRDERQRRKGGDGGRQRREERREERSGRGTEEGRRGGWWLWGGRRAGAARYAARGDEESVSGGSAAAESDEEGRDSRRGRGRGTRREGKGGGGRIRGGKAAARCEEEEGQPPRGRYGSVGGPPRGIGRGPLPNLAPPPPAAVVSSHALDSASPPGGPGWRRRGSSAVEWLERTLLRHRGAGAAAAGAAAPATREQRVPRRVADLLAAAFAAEAEERRGASQRQRQQRDAAPAPPLPPPPDQEHLCPASADALARSAAALAASSGGAFSPRAAWDLLARGATPALVPLPPGFPGCFAAGPAACAAGLLLRLPGHAGRQGLALAFAVPPDRRAQRRFFYQPAGGVPGHYAVREEPPRRSFRFLRWLFFLCGFCRSSRPAGDLLCWLPRPPARACPPGVPGRRAAPRDGRRRALLRAAAVREPGGGVRGGRAGAAPAAAGRGGPLVRYQLGAAPAQRREEAGRLRCREADSCATVVACCCSGWRSRLFPPARPPRVAHQTRAWAAPRGAAPLASRGGTRCATCPRATAECCADRLTGPCALPASPAVTQNVVAARSCLERL